jgi:glutaminyl-peptide cyclotransferase
MRKSLLFTGIILVIALFVVGFFVLKPQPGGQEFDGERAYQDVLNQVDFGPRTPGSDAHAQTIEYISDELRKAGWKVELQKTFMLDHELTNIVASKGSGERTLLAGAHYDSRFTADKDPDQVLASEPVPGANDGASGVAVLLEVARVLPKNPKSAVKLVFFDGEDQGRIPGWDWILGSRAYVNSLQQHPDAVVIIDMIGDSDLNVYREVNSDPLLTNELWTIASQLGYDEKIIDEEKYRILDDHIPFIEAGIPAVDLIDFDYPYWHTSQDTVDKVSPGSLKVIGDILLIWLEGSAP